MENATNTITLSTGLRVRKEEFYDRLKRKLYLDTYSHLENYGRIDYKKLFNFYSLNAMDVKFHRDMTIESKTMDPQLIGSINMAVQDFKRDMSKPYSVIIFPTKVKMIITSNTDENYLSWIKEEIELNQYSLLDELEELKALVANVVKEEKLALAIVKDIDDNPNEYAKYLNMKDPIQEILADWY